MGKIIIYSEKYSGFEKSFKEFEISKKVSFNRINIIAFSKLNFKTCNYYESDGNWIIGVGTFVFNGKTDKEALRDILNYWESSNGGSEHKINFIRDKTYGNYCLSLLFNGNLYVFVDSFGAYKVYYYNFEDFVLTNTWYHIRQLTGCNEINDYEFVEFLCKTDNLDKETPVKKIFRLTEYEYLLYNGKTWNINQIQYPINNCEEDFWGGMFMAYRELYEAIPSQGIFFTGGIDSRINLAMHLGVGGKPCLYYGVGNSRKTNTKEIDKYCFETAANMFSLPMQLMNWDDSGRTEIDEKIELLGEYAIIYAGNDNIYNEFRNNIEVKSISFGYFGEYIRNNEFDVNDTFTIDEYVNRFYKVLLMDSAYKYTEQYLEKYKKSLCDILRMYGINPQCISEDEITIINYHVRKNWDTRMSNYANMFTYSYMLIPNYWLMKKLFSIKYREKNNGHYTLVGLKQIFPHCLNIPVFSHNTLREIDDDKLIIMFAHKNTETLRTSLQRYYLWLRDTAVRDIYFMLKGDRKGLEEVRNERLEKKELKYLMRNETVKSNFISNKLYMVSDASLLVALMITLKLINRYHE